MQSLEKSIALKIKGDIHLVLEGKVRPNVLHEISQDEFQLALGSGTFSHIEHVGEAIMIDGFAYVSWVEEGHVHTKKDKCLKTCFLMGIKEKASHPSYREFSTAITLQNFYEEEAKQYPEGFVVTGEVYCKELHSTYLQKPPIYGENINQNSEKYWAHIPFEKDKVVKIIGVVIPDKGRQKFSQEILNRAFYHNPQEKQKTTLMSHTHCAILEKKDIGDVKENKVSSVRHLITSTLMQKGFFSFFPLESIIL